MPSQIWQIENLPKPTNGINKYCRIMNGLGNLPPPIDKIGELFKKLIVRKLRPKASMDFNYGFNMMFGNIYGGFVSLNNAQILDYAPVLFGHNVLIGPDCKLITSWHDENDINVIKATTIIIGNNVWLTMNIIVLPGVEIGSNTIIGAGSVVTHSIPANVIAAGNPARVIREKVKTEDEEKSNNP